MANSIKVRAQMLAEGRLYPNVVTPNGTRKLEQTVPDRLVDWPEDSFAGAYVLLLPTEENQAKIGKMAALAWDMLHCTVAYLGQVEDLKVTGKEIAETVKKLAADVEPIKAKLGGIIRFTAENDYHLDPVVLNVDSPSVNELRDTVLRRMKHEHDIIPDDMHGYTPHLTLGYMQHDEPLITNRVEETEVTFDRLRIGFANQEFDIRLGNQAARDDAEHRQPSVKAFMLNPFYNVALEHKKRYVRTLAGQRRFGLPIGSQIVADPVNEFPSQPWDDDEEHRSRVESTEDSLFKNIAVQSSNVREKMKHDIVTDLTNRLEEDFDTELLSRLSRRNVTDDPQPFEDVNKLWSYLENFRHMAQNVDYWTDSAESKGRQEFGVPDGVHPADHFAALTGATPEEFLREFDYHTEEGIQALDDLLAKRTVLDYNTSAKSIRYNVVNTFIAEWATSSKDYNMQLLARNQFDLKNARTEHLDDKYLNLDAMGPYNPSEVSSAAWKEAYGYYLDAVYESTQEKLAAEGITEVAVYRGMSVSPEEFQNRFGLSISQMSNEWDDMVHDWVDQHEEYTRAYRQRRWEVLQDDGDPDMDEEALALRQRRIEMTNEYLENYWERLRELGAKPGVIEILKNTAFSMPDEEDRLPAIQWPSLRQFEPVMELDIGTQPLSSWTTDPDIAWKFGGFIYKVIVPAERVWSTALTGAGCLSEKELILVGGVDHGKVQAGGSL